MNQCKGGTPPPPLRQGRSASDAWQLRERRCVSARTDAGRAVTPSRATHARCALRHPTLAVPCAIPPASACACTAAPCGPDRHAPPHRPGGPPPYVGRHRFPSKWRHRYPLSPLAATARPSPPPVLRAWLLRPPPPPRRPPPFSPSPRSLPFPFRLLPSISPFSPLSAPPPHPTSLSPYPPPAGAPTPCRADVARRGRRKRRQRRRWRPRPRRKRT